MVAVIRILAERILEVSKTPDADISAISDAVDALLDRSVGAEEYVIRAAAEGIEPDPLIDLSKIDFDALAAKFAGRKRAETDRLATLLRKKAIDAAHRNPTRFDLVERIEELIATYNAGSLNIDEYLHRLIELSQDLTAEEQRAVTEEMTEEELALFDLLTKPGPDLDDAEREAVRASAKRLLAHLHDKLVLDWRRKASTSADVNTTIRDVLDAELPADPYPPPVFEEKVQAVFDHILTAYEDRQINVYREDDAPPQERRERELEVAKDALGLSEPGSLLERERTTPGSLNLSSIVDQVVEAIRIDAEFASHVAAGMAVRQDSSLRTVAELIDNDEDFAVEFKSTARWDLREGQRSKAIEDAIVKTVAGFLNTDGGTLLISVDPIAQS